MKTLEYYLGLPYKLEIVPDTEEGGYVASYPELRGCLTCGDSIEAVAANAEDCKREWLAAALEEHLEIPEPADASAGAGLPKESDSSAGPPLVIESISGCSAIISRRNSSSS